MRKLLFTLLLVCLFGMARGQTTALYWFDNQLEAANNVIVTGGSFEADATALSDGLHALHVQCVLSDGTSSTIETRYFLRVSLQEIDQVTLLCIVDGELYSQTIVQTDNGHALWNVDLSGVSEGMHSIMLQAVTPSGEMTDGYQGFFLRVEPPSTEPLRCSYFIDDDEETISLGTISADGVVHFDLDASTLSNGLHHITYILYDHKGRADMQNRYFVKTPLGGNKLIRYQYWVNDHVDQMRTTSLAEPQNPLRLQSLLPVEPCPLRSSLFHFEFSEDQPMMYAKNTLHALFYDLDEYCNEAKEDYIDYSVSAPVVVSGVLTPNERETTAWPEANTVKWYTLDALSGDSLRFKLSCAATIQLFAPSGAEVYKADGATAVKWGGLHVEESGTFYVALHDVTATKGSSISIDYQRLDRYAVLKQDVRKVSNGGPSTITFQGNGFDVLQSVDLIKGENTIQSVEVRNNGKAEVAVKFNFNAAELGAYKAVFHFVDGDLEVPSCITVAEAVPVSYKATASYASKFLLSKGNNYNFKVRNLGNMSAYDVPMTVQVYTPNAASLQAVSGKGCTLGEYTEDAASTDIEGYPYMRSYPLTKTLPPSGTEAFTIHVKTTETVYVFLKAEGTRAGGPSTPVASLDPNDIYGYQDENGDKTIRGGLTQVYYTIEFENDPELGAEAPAHDIYVTDVLDPQLFDLSTFAPTSVKVGAKEVELDGSPNGSVTFSMMPDIYAIAQLDWSIDETTGTISWHISSLDPITVEPTEELYNGVLPVNTDGNGIGELSFDIQLKPDLPDGTEIPNRATIKFDENDPIVTPTWTNIIQSVLKGDVNGDGLVNLTDASWIVRHYVGRTPDGFIEEAADVDGDGNVNLSDAQKVVRIFVGKNN